MRTISSVLFAFVFLSIPISAQPTAKTETDSPKPTIESVSIHPLFSADYMCAEHWEGQLKYPGDDLGSDCVVFGGLPADGKSGFMKPFKTNGVANEDWFGWLEPVLVPFDSVVERIHINPVINKPGEMGKPPASFVMFKRDDGTRVIVAHVTEISVKTGDQVTAGKPFAKVGNNGYSRSPHIHVGAWRDKTPLQIKFDLRAAGKLRETK